MAPRAKSSPRRFILEGASLLAPGGTMIVACLDLTYDDGRRPFAEVCAAIEERGFTTVIERAGQPEISRRVSEHLRDRGIPATAQLCYVIVEHDV